MEAVESKWTVVSVWERCFILVYDTLGLFNNDGGFLLWDMHLHEFLFTFIKV